MNPVPDALLVELDELARRGTPEAYLGAMIRIRATGDDGSIPQRTWLSHQLVFAARTGKFGEAGRLADGLRPCSPEERDWILGVLRIAPEAAAELYREQMWDLVRRLDGRNWLEEFHWTAAIISLAAIAAVTAVLIMTIVLR